MGITPSRGIPVIASLLFFLLPGHASALNWKTGIDLKLNGIEGKDYVVEQLFHDEMIDDRSVIYLKNSVSIELSHNSRNISPLGKPVDTGWIYYKLDGDGLRTGYPFGLGDKGPDPKFSPPLFLYQSAIDLSQVKGKTGEKSGSDRDSYHQGLLDDFGDEWHVLTYWDDEGGGTKIGSENNSSDGKITLLVLDPATPALHLAKKSPDAQFYTTPPKQYYIPKIFSQTSYLSRDVEIYLTSLDSTETVEYKVGDGPWNHYRQPLLSQHLFPKIDNTYLLSYRIGPTGRIKSRTFHFEPASPGHRESHPSKMVVRDADDLRALQTRMRVDPYQRIYKGFNDPKLLNQGSERYRNGLRYGKREYQDNADLLVKLAFVCLIEGYDHADYAFADTAKAILLNLYTIDPISFEAGQITGCRKGPCMERAAYPGDHKTPAVPLAYDMMASYTTAKGQPKGFTPIEEYKVRDNLASEVNLRLKWFGTGYSDFWQTYLEGPLQAFAIAMPSYNTPYYGTSGVDGTPASYPFTPFPGQMLSWWDFCNNKGDALGYPNLGSKSLFYNLSQGAYGLGNWSEDGFWYSDDTAGYQNLCDAGWIPSLAARAKYDGFMPPRMRSYLNMGILTRNPVNLGSFPANASKDFVFPGVRSLINKNVQDAGLYMWHLSQPEPRAHNINGNVYELLYFDDKLLPQAPVQESHKYQNVISFGKNLGSKEAILFRMLNKHEPADRSNYRLPLTTHFNLVAHGEMLVVDGIKNRDDVEGRSAKGRNTVLVGDSGVSNTLDGRISQSLFTDSTDYGRVTTRRDLVGFDPGAFHKQEIDQTRHVFFPDKKYFLIVDEMKSGTGEQNYGWTLHGSSDGRMDAPAFEVGPDSVTWTKESGVRLQARFIAPKVRMESGLNHYSYFTNKVEPYIIARAQGTDLRFVTLLLPLKKDQPAPTLLPAPAGIPGDSLALQDAEGKLYLVAQDKPALMNFNNLWSSDGRISVVSTDPQGQLRHATVIQGTLARAGTNSISLSHKMDFTFIVNKGLFTLLVKPDEEKKEISLQVQIGGASPHSNYLLEIPDSLPKSLQSNEAGQLNFAVEAYHDVFGDSRQSSPLTLIRK